MQLIDFSNRTSRKDKRKKNYYQNGIIGDLCLALDTIGLDNSMGDYSYDIFEEFIESLGQEMREKFRSFLQDFANQHEVEYEE